MDSIRNFGAKTGLPPNKEFYPDPDGASRCTVCNRTFKRPQDLKAHITRTRHSIMTNDEKVTATHGKKRGRTS